MNLQLNHIDIQMIQNNLPLNEQGFVAYMEFISVAQQLITSIYNSQPDTEVIAWSVYINMIEVISLYYMYIVL